MVTGLTILKLEDVVDIQTPVLVPQQNVGLINPSAREPAKGGGPRQQQTTLENNELPTQLTVIRSGDTAAYEQAEKYRDGRGAGTNTASFDSSDGRAALAISAYQNHQNDARREEIRQLMGVDTYV